ncbi:MAG TPA: glycerol acyltransferase [Porticoccaceae bacterium]|jgi:1-acyl-sn-glycerol-3-phosphate acyltransferase|nr:glycerol acyltransferase [Gammaproteobacteria bacterium]HIL60641.1 glycerol acyltransferase [Porticoccaceae bacterium]
MRTTIFSTPIITPILRILALTVLKLCGWKTIGTDLEQKRFVVIGAPHTSNWDFPLMLSVVLKLRLEVFWMGKHTLFPFPFAWLVKWLGGIPINRAKSHSVVDETVHHYAEHEELIVLIPPEGTRAKVNSWKTGFYRIANNANVPILLGFVDVDKKQVGFAGFFYPTGDIEKDMAEIQGFYSTKKGLNAENS